MAVQEQNSTASIYNANSSGHLNNAYARNKLTMDTMIQLHTAFISIGSRKEDLSDVPVCMISENYQEVFKAHGRRSKGVYARLKLN